METYEIQQIWNRLIDKLSHATSESNMDMYIRQITPIKLENDVISCTVPSSTLLSVIQQNFNTIILAALNEITNNNMSLELKVGYSKKMNNPEQPLNPIAHFKNTDENDSFESNINKRQRFDTFVIGNSNRFAAAAAQAVAANPGGTYNPLFIYGNSGLGKTHLMHAIGNAILEADPSAKVKYVTSEIFTNEIINAIKNHTVEKFQEKYRTIDCLIIDDIQFLEKKERTQEEFFHTFNTLREADKQVVISCDRNPRDVDKLEDRLRNRFASGLTADIQPPDLETRIAILRKKIETEKLDIPNEVIQTIATSIEDNVRILEGAFNRIVAYTNLMHRPIDLEVTKEVLKEFVPQIAQRVTMDKITDYISRYYHVDISDLTGKKRSKHIAMPRQIAMYLCRSMTDESFVNIGSFFGGKNHTTVIHAYEKIDKMCKEDNNFDSLMKQLEEQIRSFR